MNEDSLIKEIGKIIPELVSNIRKEDVVVFPLIVYKRLSVKERKMLYTSYGETKVYFANLKQHYILNSKGELEKI